MSFYSSSCVGVLLPNCFMSEITHYIMCFHKTRIFSDDTTHPVFCSSIHLYFVGPPALFRPIISCGLAPIQVRPPRGNGIYVSRYDEITGEISRPKLATKVKKSNHSSLSTQRFPLSMRSPEIADLNGKPTGGIISFVVDMRSGQLTQQSVQPSQGKGPCHLSLDATGKSLLAANYGSGSVICLGITDDGSPLTTSSHNTR